MAVKITGAEMNAFMNDKNVWKAGYFFEDSQCTVDGEEDDLDYAFDEKDKLNDSCSVVVSSGVIFQGSYDAKTVSLEGEIKRWRKCRNLSYLVVEVEKSQADQIVKQIKMIYGVRSAK